MGVIFYTYTPFDVSHLSLNGIFNFYDTIIMKLKLYQLIITKKLFSTLNFLAKGWAITYFIIEFQKKKSDGITVRIEKIARIEMTAKAAIFVCEAEAIAARVFFLITVIMKLYFLFKFYKYIFFC